MIKFAPAVIGLFMVPYGALVPQSPGNPNGDAYVGQPGSTYDAAANPPKTLGVVTYDPYAPLPPANPAAPGAMPAQPAMPAPAPMPR